MENGRERSDFGGGSAFAPIHPQRQTNDQCPDSSHGHQLGDSLDGFRPTQVDGFHGVRENPKIIGRGDADARVAVVDAKRWMCRIGVGRSHVGMVYDRTRRRNLSPSPIHFPTERAAANRDAIPGNRK